MKKFLNDGHLLQLEIVFLNDTIAQECELDNTISASRTKF